MHIPVFIYLGKYAWYPACVNVYLYVNESGLDEIILGSHCVSNKMYNIVFKNDAVTLEPYV